MDKEMNNGMQELSMDELLNKVSGGVLDDSAVESLKSWVSKCKKKGMSYETALSAAQHTNNPEDSQQVADIVHSIYFGN